MFNLLPRRKLLKFTAIYSTLVLIRPVSAALKPALVNSSTNQTDAPIFVVDSFNNFILDEDGNNVVTAI